MQHQHEPVLRHESPLAQRLIRRERGLDAAQWSGLGLHRLLRRHRRTFSVCSHSPRPRGGDRHRRHQQRRGHTNADDTPAHQSESPDIFAASPWVTRA
jgi:hypothetical protein